MLRCEIEIESSTQIKHDVSYSDEVFDIVGSAGLYGHSVAGLPNHELEALRRDTLGLLEHMRRTGPDEKRD